MPGMEDGVSEVRQALYRGDRGAAEALVRQGAELNGFDAAAYGDSDRLAALLAADPELAQAWSTDGFTALHFAAYLGRGIRPRLPAGADVAAVARNDMQVQPLHSGAALGDVEAAASCSRPAPIRTPRRTAVGLRSTRPSSPRTNR